MSLTESSTGPICSISKSSLLQASMHSLPHRVAPGGLHSFLLPFSRKPSLIPRRFIKIVVGLRRKPNTHVLDRPVPILAHQFQDNPCFDILPFVKSLVSTVIIH